MQQFNISAMGQRIVFVAMDDKGGTPVMLAPWMAGLARDVCR
jgi:hypothetical protein